MDASRATREAQVDRSNRLELLLFRLQGARQRFGINVLKVKEVIACPRLTQVPQAHPAVRGIAHLRGEPLSVIDLAFSVGRGPVTGPLDEASIIITEFNRSMQGFLVERVERIVVCDWKQVLPPPPGSGSSSYSTGVAHLEDELIQILDVERVLAEVGEAELVLELEDHGLDLRGKRIMVVDDSVTARHHTARTLDRLGVSHLMARDGREALAELRRLLQEEGEAGRVDMVISDIEMPEMDGYTLTRELRNDPRLANSYILLHTSLNGAINAEKARNTGADDVLTKFAPIELAKAVIRGLGYTLQES